jgi:hypothetical protein
LRGLRWTTNPGEYFSGLTALMQLPGSNKDFVVFRPFTPRVVWSSFQGLVDLRLTGPEMQVYGINDALASGNGVAFRDPDLTTFTGNTTSGSNVVSSVSAAPSFTGLSVGGSVTGAGIPIGTRITAINFPASGQIQLDKNATATASTVALSSAFPVVVQDCFEIRNIHVSRFPENGFLLNGAVPGHFDRLLATACGGYGFAYIPNNPTTTQAVELSNFSADYCNLGAVLLQGLSSYSSFVVTNLKSESFVDSDGGTGLLKFGANQSYGAPQGQAKAIDINNCDKSPILINGLSHIRGGGVSGPGPAITIRDSSGNSRKPKLVFNAVSCRVVGTETGSIADAVTLRDEISSVDIPRAVSSACYPTQTAPPYVVDNFEKPILRFREYSPGTAQSHVEIYNGPTATPPIIGSADSDGSVVNVALGLQPKGTGRVEIYGTNPGIVGGASGNANLNLQSRGTGTVQVNGVQVADVSSAQSLSNKDLTAGTNTFPTLNQNTTGTAANITGTAAIANGGTGQTTAASAITALTGTQTAGRYLRSDGTNSALAAIVAADVPTLNQNTTGTAENVTGTVAVANGGTGSTTLVTAATASSVAARDSNGYLTANGFIPTKTSTAGAAGTTTLTVASSQIQEFTGSTTQNVYLPTTGVLAGQSWTIINNGTSFIPVFPSSGGGGILSITSTLRMGTFTARIDTPTANADWIYSVLATTSSTNTVVQRDGFSSITSNNFIATATSTATAAGTTTMTIASSQTQVFTGSTTQTLKLPTTSVVAGQIYTVVNNSSGSVTVQSSGSNTVATVTTGTLQLFVAQVSAPTTAAHWRAI